MRFQKTLKISAAILFVILFSGFFTGSSDPYFEISKNIELFGRVYKEISFNYVDEVDPESFMRAGIEGMLKSLDPYTIFVDEEKQDDIDLMTNGKYGGIGISIGVRGDDVTIIEVMDGYAAQKQGLRVGDVLIEASGEEVSPENMDDISSLVKGEPGTTVNIKIIRNANQDTLNFNLIREEVILKNITYADFYPENSSNVFIKLTNFSRSAADELRTSLKELNDQKKIESIILDLRGNPGGLLDVAVKICDKFLQRDQLIVTTKGRSSESVKTYYAVEEPVAGNERLIVLINESSASASEIVAGAIQDHDRGIILGTKSFGKGLVQTITPLSYNTSLKITTAKYYTPSGRCIQKVDYSKDNDVITVEDTLLVEQFATDNERVVTSAGGITPDTLVENGYDGELTQDLLAKGYFFNFADNYFYSNPGKDFNNLNENVLFNEFEEYLEAEDYDYESSLEKKIVSLVSDIEDDATSEDVKNTLTELKKQVREVKEKEFKVYREEIISLIKTELALRYEDRETETEEKLRHDTQVQTALSIINDDQLYNRILNNN